MITVWLNASKEGYSDANYTKQVTVKAWKESDPKLHIESDLPDTLKTEGSKAFTLTVTSDGNPIEDAHVTLKATGPAHTCKEKDDSKPNGEVSCVLTALNVTGEDMVVTVWLNATMEGYEPAYYTKQVTILANLAARKIRGIESRGMVLLAEDPSGKLIFVAPDQETAEGSAVL